jgi:hypothetical protein
MAKTKAEQTLNALIKPSVGANTIAFNPRNDLEDMLITHFQDKHSLYSVLNLGLPSPSGVRQICFDISDTTELVFHKFVYFWFSQKEFVSQNLQAYPKTITQTHPDDEISDKYIELSEELYKITSFEKDLDTDENKDAQNLFEKRLGKPVFYTRRERANYQALDLSLGNSWIGNLVDESKTLKIKDISRPMKNYHEFFSSTLTTLNFDGDKFFTNIKHLKSLCTEVQGFDIIYTSIQFLLRHTLHYGLEFYSELATDDSSEILLSRLKTNLDHLNLELLEPNASTQDH